MTDMSGLSPSAQKVQNFLKQSGYPFQVTEIPASTRTSQEAADALGCEVKHIAKSLVFQGALSHQPVLIVASGEHRVDEKIAGRAVGEPIAIAKPEFVLQTTGFAVGGVPPVGHHQKLPTYIDRTLMKLPFVWTAAGSSHAVFRLSPVELLSLTGGELIDVM